MVYDASSDQDAILADFVDEAQSLQTPTEARPDRGWDYELRLDAWLSKIYEQYGVSTARRQALDSALRSIFERDDHDDALRFSAFYCYAMHLWNANRLSDHKQLIQDILDRFNDTHFMLIRHRRAMDYLSRALTSGDPDQRKSNSESALEESAKCLTSNALSRIAGVANIYGNIVIFMIENSFTQPLAQAHSDAQRGATVGGTAMKRT